MHFVHRYYKGSALSALAIRRCQAQQHIAEGCCWVDIDLEKFFDRVNHDKSGAEAAHCAASGEMVQGAGSGTDAAGGCRWIA